MFNQDCDCCVERTGRYYRNVDGYEFWVCESCDLWDGCDDVLRESFSDEIAELRQAMDDKAVLDSLKQAEKEMYGE